MKFKIKRRHRLRKKDWSNILEQLEHYVSDAEPLRTLNVEIIETDRFTALVCKGVMIAVLNAQRPIPTVKGLEILGMDRNMVKVDMGAVPYVTNGADVMCPGIVWADPAIRTGDIVYVVDEKYAKNLATGLALIDGKEMVERKSGKAIKVVSWVGDQFWSLSL